MPFYSETRTARVTGRVIEFDSDLLRAPDLLSAPSTPRVNEAP